MSKKIVVVVVFAALLGLAGNAMGQNLITNPTFTPTLSPGWYTPNYTGSSGIGGTGTGIKTLATGGLSTWPSLTTRMSTPTARVKATTGTS